MKEGTNKHQAKMSVQPAQSQRKVCVSLQKSRLHIDEVTKPAAVDISL